MDRQKAQLVIAGIHEGQMLKELMPSGYTRSQFYELLEREPDLQNLYLSAQASKAELLVDESVDIADNDPDPARARIRVQARQWAASKYRPQRFGDRLEVNVDQKVDLTVSIAEGRKRAGLVAATLVLPSSVPHPVNADPEPIHALESPDWESDDEGDDMLG